MKTRNLILFGLTTVGLFPAARGQNSVTGQWGPLQALPWRPAHSILLPTGNVLIYPASDDVRLWDPITTAVTSLPGFGFNPFCNGHAHLADGRVLLAGGHVMNSVGLPNASIFDPGTSTFVQQPNMDLGRWYPSLVTLASGDVVVMSGEISPGVVNAIPEVWEDGTSTWRELTAAPLVLPLYPSAFMGPDGRVFVATFSSRYLDTSGTGAWTFVDNQNDSGRDNYGSACLLADGRVMFAGGGDPPLSSCEEIDLNAVSPSWSFVSAMPEARRQHNVTILPDGSLLVTGGSSSAGFNTPDGPKAAIHWNPDTDVWTTWATETEYRGYHSEAVLLPDARVASIGGDGTPSLQVFSPPYLFQGPRPTISAAPSAVCIGQSFFVATPDATNIAHVTWVRPSAVTHTQNMNQRVNRLAFTPAGGGLTVNAPPTGELCPPGDYMMFLINSSGIPSIATWIRASIAPQGPTVYCTAKTNSLGCVPTIAFSGGMAASFSSPSSFDLSASQVINHKNGLLFYGTSGRANIPFLGATLCSAPPLGRTTVQGSGGNPPPNDCSGTFTFDFNAWIQGGNDPFLTVGSKVNGQFWSRDPQIPDGTGSSLTDAVEFDVCQ